MKRGEVFIQQALVEEGYRGKGDFYSENQKLVEELQALEDRFRRRDLLVEQQVIFEFYRSSEFPQASTTCRYLKNGASRPRQAIHGC